MKWKDVLYNLSISVLLFLMIQIVAGCSSTPKVVTRQTYISDRQSHWDSLFNARVSATFERFQQSQKEQREMSKVETNHIRDSTSTMVDKDGNILRKDKYHYESHNYSEKDIQKLKDSVSYYKSYKDRFAAYRLKIDSLQKERQDSIPYPVYVEKQLGKMDSMFLRLGKICATFIVLFAVILIILPFIKAKIKKK